jgi:hypothetical protein
MGREASGPARGREMERKEKKGTGPVRVDGLRNRKKRLGAENWPTGNIGNSKPIQFFKTFYKFAN